MSKIIKQIEEYDTGEYCSALFTVALEDGETIEEVIAWEFAQDNCYSDFDCTGRWYKNKGRVIDTCGDLFLIRQTACLDV